MPFTAHDTMISIANKIISLKQETLEDTKQLINTEAFKKSGLSLSSIVIALKCLDRIISFMNFLNFNLRCLELIVMFFFTGLQGGTASFC